MEARLAAFAARCIAVVGLIVGLCANCGSPATTSGPVTACAPGKSTLCGGPHGCVGFQVCATDGSAYGPCDCGDAAASADAQADSADMSADAAPACIGTPSTTSCVECCSAAIARGACANGCCAGCTLIDADAGICAGSLAPCSELQADKCTNQDGCRLAGSGPGDAASMD